MIQRIVAAIVVVGVLATLMVVSQLRVEPLMSSGIVECDDSRLGSLVGGRVKAVHVKEGDEVTAGQLLVELEPYDLVERRQQAAARLAEMQAELDRLQKGFRQEEIAQAVARVDQLEANLAKLEAGPRPQEIEAARARLEVVSAMLELVQQNLARTLELYEQGVETEENYEEATQLLKKALAERILREQELDLLVEGTRAEEIQQAEAQLAEAQAALDLVRIGFREEEIDRARASVEAAGADLAAVEKQLKELSIVAPSDGQIEAIDLQPGDLVGAGAPVLSMLHTSHQWVRAYVPENRLIIKVGDEVFVTVDSYPDRKFRARITFIAGQAEFMPSNVQTPEERSKQVFRITATLEEGHDELHPGMPADVWLEERE